MQQCTNMTLAAVELEDLHFAFCIEDDMYLPFPSNFWVVSKHPLNARRCGCWYAGGFSSQLIGEVLR